MKQQWKRLTWPEPRSGASGEDVPPPTTGLLKGQSWSGVAVGNFFFPPFFYLKKPIAGTLKGANPV